MQHDATDDHRRDDHLVPQDLSAAPGDRPPVDIEGKDSGAGVGDRDDASLDGNDCAAALWVEGRGAWSCWAACMNGSVGRTAPPVRGDLAWLGALSVRDAVGAR